MLRRFADIAVDVTGSNVHKNKADQLAVLAAHRRRTRFVMDIGQHRDRDLCACRRGNEHALERVEVFAKVARITRVHRITLTPFHGGRNVLAADGGFDDVVDVADSQAVTRGRFAVDGEIEKISADCALGERAARIWKLSQFFLDLDTKFLNLAKIWTKNFHAEDATKSRGEHFRARLDWHPKN